MIVEVSDEMRLDRGSIPLISIDKKKALLGKYPSKAFYYFFTITFSYLLMLKISIKHYWQGLVQLS